MNVKSALPQAGRVRWRLLVWPAALLAIVCGVAFGWIWTGQAEHRQSRVMATLALVVPSVALLMGWALVWLLALSRLRWRSRLLWLAGMLVLLVGAASSLTLRGVSGDVVPILGWRWSTASGELERAAPPPAATFDGAVSSPFDYPQFLGPRRDGTLPGPRLARSWPEEGPRELWRRPIGAGWSGFAVSGDYAVTQEQRGPEEWVTAYELDSGRLVWSHADRARFDDVAGGLGPRATPTIHEGRVYALGATGILNVLDLRGGRAVWSKNVVVENEARVATYGVSVSPLVIGARVVVAVGGPRGKSMVAYDRDTGERAWSGGSDPPGYSSPILAELAGREQILILNGDHVAAHDPDNGAVLWSYPWPQETQPVSQPVAVSEDRVFVSSGYGVGGKLLRVRSRPGGGLRVELVWETLGLKAKFTNVVHRDGFLYGLDDGILVCLEVATGSRRWKQGRYGHGQVILVDDLLLVLGERGDVSLVEASPEAFRELASFQTIRGKTWNHPALAGRKLLVRNDREAACYELPAAGRSAGREG